MRTNDEQLVNRTLAGDRDAFAELVDRYRDAVCAVAYSYLGNFDDVQDAAQDAFVQAYRQLAQLREPSKLGPWMRRITSNVCLGMLRKKDYSLLPLDGIPEHADVSNESPFQTIDNLTVRDAVSSLSENARVTLTLFHINGYSHAEMADFLEVPVDTIRSRLRSARKQLSKEMINMFTDELSEGKKKVRITNEYVLYRDDLVENTGIEELDDFLYMMVNVLRIAMNDRVRSIFLTGDYASGKIAPESKLDLTIFLIDEIDTKQDDMRRVWSLIEHMVIYMKKFQLGGIGLNTVEIYRQPSVLISGQGYLPGAEQKDAVKNHSLLLSGEDIRPTIVLE